MNVTHGDANSAINMFGRTFVPVRMPTLSIGMETVGLISWVGARATSMAIHADSFALVLGTVIVIVDGHEADSEERKNMLQIITDLKVISAKTREVLDHNATNLHPFLHTRSFERSQDVLTAKQAALKEQLDECEAQYEANHQKSLAATTQQQTVTQMSGLSDDKLREHLYDAVERVLVYDTETIEIVWKFNEAKIDTDENIRVAK